MADRYDLLTTRKDRDGKARYTKVGTMFPRKEGDGFSLKFDALPLANEQGEVWVSAYPPKPREDAPQQRQISPGRASVSAGPARDMDDDIPF